MSHAQEIKRRLNEIEAELGSASGGRPAAGSADSEIIGKLHSFVDLSDWLDRQSRLAAERRRLLHEYERLPKRMKGET